MRRLLGIVLLLVAGCRACSCGDEITALDALAALGDSSGDVRRRAAGASAWDGLAVGEDLFSGDWVQTGASAAARVDFKSGAKLKMGPSSTVVIDDPSSKQRLSVKAGTIEGSLLADAQIVVSTPDGAEVRLASKGQTNYRVSVGTEGKVELAVTEGALDITSPDGQTARIEPGQASEIKAGRLVGERRILPLPPKRLETRPGAPRPGVSATPILIQWEQGTAKAHRIQISAEPSFENPISDQRVEGARFELVPPGPGTYFVRIASESDDGRIGAFSPAERIVAAPPPAEDRLVSPAENTVLRVAGGSAVVEFAWKASSPNARVKLRVSAAPDLSPPVMEEESDKGKTRLRGLAPGVYWWGAFEIAPDGTETPLFPAARKLEVRREAGDLRVPNQIKWRDKKAR